MNLFKTVTLKWWQAAFLKVGLLATGIAVGIYWYGLFSDCLLVFVIIAVICLAYYTFVWSKQ